MVIVDSYSYSWNENGSQNGTESEIVSGWCNLMKCYVLG